MNLIGRFCEGPTRFSGSGVNHEQETFRGELRVHSLVGGKAVLLIYTATLADGTVAHEEATLLGMTAEGALCLWPVMSELPGVLSHLEKSAEARPNRLAVVFASGPRDDASVFREEITIALAEDGSVTYAHAWGLPGGAFADRSSCRLMPSET